MKLLLRAALLMLFSNLTHAHTLDLKKPVITDARAFWLQKTIIAYNNATIASCEIVFSSYGKLSLPKQRGTGIPLLNIQKKLTNTDYAAMPNVAGYSVFQIPTAYEALIPNVLKGAFAFVAFDADGNILDATGLQISGILDDVFAYSGSLGVSYQNNTPTLHVWAPTAKNIHLQRFANHTNDSFVTSQPLTYNPKTGVWSIVGTPDWNEQYYLLEVDVYVPETGKFMKNIVTDPYAISLAANGAKSQFINLDDPKIAPKNWANLQKPNTDLRNTTIYEVHTRDFSINDPTVAAQDQGKFTAFGYDGKTKPISNGMAHLIRLAGAGLTHIELLPSFDFGSVNEIVAEQAKFDLKGAPDSDTQQATYFGSREKDGFNWGYDPVHYGVPEGGYSTNPNGSQRILEFRSMVEALNTNNLRVIMDVVYNHTFQAGQNQFSVLDKIVPNYYYRLSQNGQIQRTSCCPDLATEYRMTEKLMFETILRWIKYYKIDGFRFDLMNFHTVDAMVRLKKEINALTIEKDGIDGKNILLLGEGWDFGSAKEKGLYIANQSNMAGTGIGTFNDRIRDALHGGYNENPIEIRKQGVINGLSYDWNGYEYQKRTRTDLLFETDRLKVGLAGGLKTYQFTDANDQPNTGIGLNYTGYTDQPHESISYVSKHDNETLFDQNVFKMPMGEAGMATTSVADRLQAQNIAISFIALGQGTPFFHLGCDMLRSKSLDRDSYNSGDWYNKVDFSYTQNNFGVGLPNAEKNAQRWDIMRPLLANKGIYPTKNDIVANTKHLETMLKIRQSSPLFALPNAQEIQKRLKFYNTGAAQQDALVVMELSDEVGERLDKNNKRILVFFNANKTDQMFVINEYKEKQLALHPAQASDATAQKALFNSKCGLFTIPARTTCVFLLK